MSLAAFGVRICWPDLPEVVRVWVEEVVGGGAVIWHQSQAGGFSPGTADRVLTVSGRGAFVKAVSPDQNEHTPNLHRREASIVAQLPGTGRTPQLLGCYDDGHWVALVYEEIQGHTPQLPWIAAEIDAAMAASQLAEHLTPDPNLASLVEEYRHPFEGWARIADHQPTNLDPWVADHLGQLVELAAEGLDALSGDTLVHADVRADNLLVGPDGFVTVVDWPWACQGAAWVDRLLLIVNIDLYGGHDPDDLVDRHLSRLTSPQTITATIAGLCGYFADTARQPPPPGLPTVRAFQAAQAASTLAWLRRRVSP